MYQIASVEVLAVSVWLLLVGILCFIWAVNEIRDPAGFSNNFVDAVATLSIMLVMSASLGIIISVCTHENERAARALFEPQTFEPREPKHGFHNL